MSLLIERLALLRAASAGAVRGARRRIADVLLVVLGFLLAVGWDQWKTYRDDQKEWLRATRAVQEEVVTDLARVTYDEAFLHKDMEAADSSQEVIEPLEPLLAGAIQTSLLRGSFDSRSLALTAQVQNVFASIETANYVVHEREAYRMTNGAMSNYHTRRKLIDADVSTQLQRTAADLSALNAALLRLN